MVSRIATLLALLLVLTGCAEKLGGPSSHALGVGARQGGLFDEKGATDCVGKLIRGAGLRQETLEHVARGDLAGDSDWTMGEGETGPFDHWVEYKMDKKCGVLPWVSASSLGESALEGGLTNDPKAANCVGALIRDADLRKDFLGGLPHSSFNLPEEKWWRVRDTDKQAFKADVESKMPARCGVRPWPEKRPWNEAPAL